MIIEHILFNLSIAIIIGLLYQTYTGRNPSWLIVAATYLPDIDYIFQELWHYIYQYNKYIFPLHINHGDFHNIISVIILTILFTYIYKIYLYGKFIDGIICIGIGGFAHIIEDIIVYDHTYYLLYPFSKIQFHTFNWIPETRNIMGIGDSHIIMVGLTFVLICIGIRYIIEGDKFIHYVNTHIKPIPSICISMIYNMLEL